MTLPKEIPVTTEAFIPDFERTNEIAALSPFRDRLAESFKTLFLHELPEKNHRLERAGAFVAGLSTQAVDRGRAMAIVLPVAFDEVLEHGVTHGWNGYQTGSTAALVVGGIFGTWGYGVGKIFKKSLDTFPKTTETVTKNHPVMVGVIGKAIDGFPAQSELAVNEPEIPTEGYAVNPYQTRKTRLGKVGLGITRGLKTAFLYGSTPHVGVAKVSGHSDQSVEKRLRAVSIESALALGGIAAGVSGMVTHDFLGVAEDVKDVITNKQLLTSVSFGLVGYTAFSNFVSRKVFQKSNKSNLDKAESV